MYGAIFIKRLSVTDLFNAAEIAQAISTTRSSAVVKYKVIEPRWPKHETVKVIEIEAKAVLLPFADSSMHNNITRATIIFGWGPKKVVHSKRPEHDSSLK